MCSLESISPHLLTAHALFSLPSFILFTSEQKYIFEKERKNRRKITFEMNSLNGIQDETNRPTNGIIIVFIQMDYLLPYFFVFFFYFIAQSRMDSWPYSIFANTCEMNINCVQTAAKIEWEEKRPNRNSQCRSAVLIWNSFSIDVPKATLARK